MFVCKHIQGLYEESDNHKRMAKWSYAVRSHDWLWLLMLYNIWTLNRPALNSYCYGKSLYSQLPPCGHLAITDSSNIPGESYRRLTEINFRYYGLSLQRTYGHFIRSQRHNFIVFSLVIADTEQHLGIFAHMSSQFFFRFQIVFVVLIGFRFLRYDTIG